MYNTKNNIQYLITTQKTEKLYIIFSRLFSELKLQYFGHLMRRADSLERNLMLGKTEGRRRRGRQRMRWLDGTTDSMDEFEQTPGVGDRQGSLAVCFVYGVAKELDMTKQINNNNNNSSTWPLDAKN